MTIILTQNDKPIMGIDGLMYVDGRLSIDNVRLKVEEHNDSLKKNFPHKIANGFYFAGSSCYPLKRISKTYSL